MMHLFDKYEGHELWFEMVEYSKSKVIRNDDCFSDFDLVHRCFQVMRIMPEFNAWISTGMEAHGVRTVRELLKKFLSGNIEYIGVGNFK